MADNVTLDAPAVGDGAVIATDDIGGIQYQRVKVVWGVDGAAVDASASNPLPVVDPSSAGILTAVQGTLAVGGTVAATQSGTWTVQPGNTQNTTPWKVDGSGVTQPVSGTVTADTELPVAVALAENLANPTSPLVGSALLGFDGTTWDRLRAGSGDGASATGMQNVLPMVYNGTTHDRMKGDATDGLLVNLGANNDVTVSGVSTAAKQDTIIGHVDGLEGLLTTIDADTGSISTSAATIAGAVAGTEMQVDVVGSLPAGANAIGKLAANAGVNIGDVGVSAIVPGTGATNLGKAEDAAHTSGDVGVMMLGVRSDAGGPFGADGDYGPLSLDATGAVRVTGGGGGTQYAEDTASGAGDTGTLALVVRKDVAGSTVDADGDRSALQVDAAGALRVTGGGGGTEYVVNAVAPADPTGTASLMERDDALSALSEVEGDWTNMRSNANGALWVKHDGTTIVDGSGVTQPVSGTVAVTNAALGVVGGGTEAAALRVTIATDSTGVVSIDDNGGSITVDGTVTATLAAGSANIGDVDVLTVPAPLSTTGGGTEATAQRVTIANDSTGLVSVDDNGGSLTVDNPALSVTGNGTAAGSQRVTLASDSTGVIAVTDNGGSLTVDNPALSVVGGGTEAAAQRVTIANDSTGVVSIDDNGGSVTVDGTLTVNPAASATGGWTPHKLVSAATTNATSVKASAGRVGYVIVTNINAAARYLKLYNKASAPTVGTDTPVHTFLIPGNTAGAGLVLGTEIGIGFSTGIAYALTTGAADADTGAVASAEIIVNLGYA